MKNNPLVTIGIPTYNRPYELKRAVDAAINQSYENIEILISDNCSPDVEVERMCRDYADKDERIKYYRQDENIGMARNGEFVLNKASGEYYIWCMDDDWLSQNFIKESIAFLLKNPLYSVAFGDMNFYNLDYSLDRKCSQSSFDEERSEERILKYCKTAISSSLSFGLTKTVLMQEAYTNKMRLPEDWIFMMKTLFQAKGKYIPNISYNALNNGSSKNIEGLQKAFNLPYLTQDNFWNFMAENIVESILFDEYYVNRLTKEERISLALKVNNTLMKNDQKSHIIKRILRKLRGLYARL